MLGDVVVYDGGLCLECVVGNCDGGGDCVYEFIGCIDDNMIDDFFVVSFGCFVDGGKFC